jgi:hypothetical protein
VSHATNPVPATLHMHAATTMHAAGMPARMMHATAVSPAMPTTMPTAVSATAMAPTVSTAAVRSEG